MKKSAEQQARDILELYGVEDAQSLTAGDLVELANLIRDANEYRRQGKPTRKVWVVLATEGESDYRYLSSVYDSAEKAEAYAGANWGMDAEEAEVQ